MTGLENVPTSMVVVLRENLLRGVQKASASNTPQGMESGRVMLMLLSTVYRELDKRSDLG